MKIRSLFDGSRVPVALDFDGVKSLAHQSFKGEADVNNIMSRYTKTGLLVDPSIPRSRSPQYGDFTSGNDFTSIQRRVAAVNQAFEALDSDIRKMFDNDPSKMLDFISNPANAAEAFKLGLIKDDPQMVLPFSDQPKPASDGSPVDQTVAPHTSAT